MSPFFTSGGQSSGAWASASASVFPMNTEGWFIKRKETRRRRGQTGACRGRGQGGMNWELGVRRCKLLSTGWVSTGSTGERRELDSISWDKAQWKGAWERMYVCAEPNHCAVKQELTQHWKPTVRHWDKAQPRSRASLVAQLVKNPPAMQETPVLIPGLGKIAWRRD